MRLASGACKVSSKKSNPSNLLSPEDNKMAVGRKVMSPVEEKARKRLLRKKT